MNSQNQNWMIAAGLILIGLLCILIFHTNQNATPSVPLANATTQATRSKAPPVEATKKIKVGVVLSHFSATGLVGGKPFGYEAMKWLIREDLRSPELDLYIVIDAGTAAEGELPNVIRTYFAGKSPIECTNHDGLAELDVIVTLGQPRLTPEMIAGLTDFVSERGHGLVVRSVFGISAPGMTPEVAALTGLVEAHFFYGNDKDAECTTIATHPILGDLPAGTRLMMQIGGQYGVIAHGEPLIALTDPLFTAQVEARGANQPFAPLYTSKLGKGKIVGAVWSWVNKKIDPPITSAQLMQNSIKWLVSTTGDERPSTNSARAENPIETPRGPTTSAAQ